MTDFKRKSRPIVIIIIFAFLFQISGIHNAYADCEYHSGEDLGTGSTGSADETKDNQKYNENCPDFEPIFIDRGEFYYNHTDVTIPSRGMPVKITRYYRSQKTYSAQFGYGWYFNYHMRLKHLADDSIIIQNGNGKIDEYTYDVPNDEYIPPAGVFAELTDNGDGTFTLTDKHGTRYIFDSDGKLASITDRNNNEITFTYDPAGKLPVIGKSPYFVNQTEDVIARDYKLTTITDTLGRDITFGYNANGRLETITDFAGRTWTYTYEDDNLISVKTPASSQYPAGLTITYGYDTEHNLETVTDAKSQTYLTNHYNAERKVDTQTYGTAVASVSYDEQNNKTTMTDFKGFQQKLIYDGYGNPVSKTSFTSGLRPTDPASYTTTYTYNADMQKTSETLPEGNGIKYTYDEANESPRARGNLLEIRRKTDMAQPDNDTNDIITTFTYEPNFNFIKTITDPKGNVTTYTYDYELDPFDPRYGEAGNLVTITYPMVEGQIPQVEFDYNQYGQLVEVVDPNNNSTKYDYFAATGYLKEIIQDQAGINAVTQFTHDDYGNLASTIDARGNTTTFLYNEMNWLIEQTDSLGYKTKYSYDENGNLARLERQANTSATRWQTTQYSYTMLDQLQTITDPLNRVTTFGYDANGNRISVLDAEGNTTTYDYDERNLLWKVTDANTPTGITEYFYDYNGNLEKIEDAKDNPTTYAYDLFDRLETTTYADSSFSQFGYDKNSNLTSHLTPKGESIVYDYDSLNRLDTKTYPLTPTLDVDYGYDVGSRLTAVSNQSSAISYQYDDLNRITSSTQTLTPNPYTLTYEYDNAGNRTRVVYPSGQAINYTYDALNRLTRVSNSSGARMVQYIYDTLSRRTEKDIYGQRLMRTLYEYDSTDRLTSMVNEVRVRAPEPPPKPGIRPFKEIEGLRSRLRNILRIFSFIPKLAEAATVGETISEFGYIHDRVGNRVIMVGTHGTHGYGYDDTYQLTQVTGAQSHTYDYDAVGNREVADGAIYASNGLNQYTQVGANVFSYDGNGNLTDDGTNSYTYDVENRLLSAISPQSSASYEYDGLGRRISKTVDGNTTYFIYDGDRVVEERDVSGVLEASYVYGEGVDEVLTMERNSQKYYYFYDGLGSVTDITNTSGEVIESYSYDVYGAPSQTSTVGNPYYFTGRRYDEESGIYYYRARMYDSSIGRFLQRDPIGYFDSMNLYSYVGNNPVNWMDPWGLCKEDKRMGWRDELGRLFGPGVAYAGEDALPSNYVPDVPWWHVGPERGLRWMGRGLGAFGFKVFGKTLGVIGIILEPGGNWKITGIIIGGATGAAIGSFIPIPGAPVFLGIGGGIIGGTIGGRFDPSGAGYVY